MALEEYKRKRDFQKTSEPQGTEVKKHMEKPVYAIQKHQASHLHYDLRLEEEGVLKSWAVPKSPPTQEGIRRLAIQTEDHPLGYEEFEGVIPEGQYGAGNVVIWDNGNYIQLESKPTKKIIEIKGKKLKGRYCLLKLKPKEPEDKNWLFFKLKEKKIQPNAI